MCWSQFVYCNILLFIRLSLADLVICTVGSANFTMDEYFVCMIIFFASTRRVNKNCVAAVVVCIRQVCVGILLG